MDVKLRSTWYPEASLELKMPNKQDFPVSAACQSKSSSLLFLAVVGDAQTQAGSSWNLVCSFGFLSQALSRWSMLLISV